MIWRSNHNLHCLIINWLTTIPVLIPALLTIPVLITANATNINSVTYENLNDSINIINKLSYDNHA